MTKKTSTLKEFLVLDSTEESIVVLLLKENKSLSVSDISKGINLARTSIYNALNKMLQKQIVKKNGFRYSISDKKINKHTTQKTSTAQSIKECLNEITRLKKGEIVYSIESDGEINELFKDKRDFIDWQKKVSQRGIVFKGIGSKIALQKFRINLNEEMIKNIKSRSGSARFTDKPLEGYCNIILFRDSIIFASRVKDYFFRIDDNNISDFMKNIVYLFDDLLEYKPIV